MATDFLNLGQVRWHKGCVIWPNKKYESKVCPMSMWSVVMLEYTPYISGTDCVSYEKCVTPDLSRMQKISDSWGLHDNMRVLNIWFSCFAAGNYLCETPICSFQELFKVLTNLKLMRSNALYRSESNKCYLTSSKNPTLQSVSVMIIWIKVLKGGLELERGTIFPLVMRENTMIIVPIMQFKIYPWKKVWNSFAPDCISYGVI